MKRKDICLFRVGKAMENETGSGSFYFLNCFKSNNIYLEYADGTIITLREALDGEKVTIESLIDHGLEVTTEPIRSSSVVNE